MKRKRKFKPWVDNLLFVDLYLPQDRKLKKKVETFKLLERQRMILLKEIAYDIELLKVAGINEIILEQIKQLTNPEWKLEYNEERIKIYIPDVLPTIYIKMANEAAGYFANKWKFDMAFLIRKWKKFSTFKYQKVFVWFKFFHPIEFDCDNKFFKPLIDGIVLSELIKDDNNTILKFGFEGIISHENPHVEVFIFGDQNVPESIKKGIN
ncbi:hypothetical protein [Clostridium tyrobutyricum]|uniref:hypothetical protein n=1 Tax=Clostridium tyrobutyricum TaxID=1519 RepID=UPI000ABC664C|nr:hypothetical protein [Clostridium tyrobutyricum]